MPQRQTAHVPSHVPVGQPLYIFDVGTHKFDGTLYRLRGTHTHHPSLRFYGHLKPMIPPLSSRGSPPLYICYIQDSISHTLYMLNFLIDHPPPQNNSHDYTHYISLPLYLSHTTPRRWCTYTRREQVHRARTHASCPATPARVHGGAHFFTKWQPTC